MQSKRAYILGGFKIGNKYNVSYYLNLKPKLIILNGPLGVGKSILAKRYAMDHPLTLVLDIDDVWAMLSSYRRQKETSLPLSKDIAIEMARVVLQSGHDVIIPQIIQSLELVDKLIGLSTRTKANYFEVMLEVAKTKAIKRFIERGQSQGHPTGFRVGGVIDSSGREKLLNQMYDDMMDVASSRQHVIRIESIKGDGEATYALLQQSLGYIN